MNPFLSLVELSNQLFNHDDDEQNDVEAVTEELREAMAERDNLRRQLSAVRKAHEELHRALYPGLHSCVACMKR